MHLIWGRRQRFFLKSEISAEPNSDSALRSLAKSVVGRRHVCATAHGRAKRTQAVLEIVLLPEQEPASRARSCLHGDLPNDARYFSSSSTGRPTGHRRSLGRRYFGAAAGGRDLAAEPEIRRCVPGHPCRS